MNQMFFPSKKAVQSALKFAVAFCFHQNTLGEIQQGLNLNDLKDNVENMLKAAGLTVIPKDSYPEQSVLWFTIYVGRAASDGAGHATFLQFLVGAKLNTTLLLPTTYEEIMGCVWANHIYGIEFASVALESVRAAVQTLTQELIDLRNTAS